MLTDNLSSVPIQYNFMQIAQVSFVDACHCFDSHYHNISIQGLGGLDHELRSPPARYSSTMPVGYDDPPHLAMVGVHLPIFIPPSLMAHVALSKGPGGHQGIEHQRQLELNGHPTPGMTSQRIPHCPLVHLRAHEYGGLSCDYCSQRWSP